MTSFANHAAARLALAGLLILGAGAGSAARALDADAGGAPLGAARRSVLFFTPNDNDQTATVVVLYNTTPFAKSVGVKAYDASGTVVSQSVDVPARARVRLVSAPVTAPPPSWTGAGIVSVGLSDSTTFVRLLVPPGVKVDGSTVFTDAGGGIDPGADQGGMALRFSAADPPGAPRRTKLFFAPDLATAEVVVLYNTTRFAKTVTLTTYDALGNVVVSESVPVPARGRARLVGAPLVADPPPSWDAAIQVNFPEDATHARLSVPRGVKLDGSRVSTTLDAGLINPEVDQQGMPLHFAEAASRTAPRRTTVFYAPNEDGSAASVVALYNTTRIAKSVGVKAYDDTGALVVDQSVAVPARTLVRMNGSQPAANAVQLWWNVPHASLAFPYTTTYVRLGVPKGVNVDGYTVFVPSLIDPSPQATIPLRFSTADPPDAPRKTTAFFSPNDNDSSASVVALYNTTGIAKSVAVKALDETGAFVVDQIVPVPARGRVRLVSGGMVNAPPSWSSSVIVGLTDAAAHARLVLPKGVKIDGYTIFGLDSVDPTNDQGAIPLRFATPAHP